MDTFTYQVHIAPPYIDNLPAAHHCEYSEFDKVPEIWLIDDAEKSLIFDLSKVACLVVGHALSTSPDLASATRNCQIGTGILPLNYSRLWIWNRIKTAH